MSGVHAAAAILQFMIGPRIPTKLRDGGGKLGWGLKGVGGERCSRSSSHIALNGRPSHLYYVRETGEL